MKKNFIKRFITVGLAVSLVNSGFSSPLADTGLLGNVSAFADEINDEEPVETAGEGVVTEPSADEEIEVPSIPEPEDEKGSVSEDEAEDTWGGSTVSDDEAVEETVSRNETEEPAGDTLITVNGVTYDTSKAGASSLIGYQTYIYRFDDTRTLVVSGTAVTSDEYMTDSYIKYLKLYQPGRDGNIDWELILDDNITKITGNALKSWYFLDDEKNDDDNKATYRIHCKKLPSSLVEVAHLENIDFEGVTELPSGLTTIGLGAFFGCTTLSINKIPDGVTSIGGNAFDGCENITLTSLPSGVTSIGFAAFRDCKKIALTSLPSQIKKIEGDTFKNCTNLALTSLPSGVTGRIESNTFYGCENLALTSLPSGIEYIDSYAFYNCKNITLTSLPAGLRYFGEYSFYGCEKMALTSLPENMIITEIPEYAFYDCKNITFEYLPDSIKEVKDYGFYHCRKLALKSLPESLEVIDWFAFSGCDSITSLSFPDSMSYIGDCAFSECFNLSSISLPDIFYDLYGTPTFGISESAFRGTSSLVYIDYHGVKDVPENLVFSVGYGGVPSNGHPLVLNTNNASFRNLDWDECGVVLMRESDLANRVYWIHFDLQGGVLVADRDAYDDVVEVYDGVPNKVPNVYNYYQEKYNESGVWNEFAVKDGYELVGWAESPDGTVNLRKYVDSPYRSIRNVYDLANPGETKTLYAIWREKSDRYKVRFVSGNGCTGYMEDQEIKCGETTSLSLNGFSKEGYVFNGWATTQNGEVVYNDGQKVKDLAKKNKTIDLYAVWREADHYNIVFHSNYEPDATSTQVAVCGESVSLKSNPFIRESGYTFKGWATTQNGAVVYTNGQTVKDLAGKDESVHLYAVWIEPDSYIIKFHSNFGEDETAQQLVLCGKSTKLTANKFVRGQNYTFEGWSLTQDGNVAYADEATVKDLAEKDQIKHLYAVWTRPDSYDIEFHSNFGTEKTYVQSVECGKTISLSANSFVRKDGYIFKGWSLTQDGDVAYEDKATVTDLAGKDETIPLYAVWKMEADEVIDLSKAQDGSVVAYWYEDEAKLFVTGAGEMDSWKHVARDHLEFNSPLIGKGIISKRFELIVDDNVTNIGSGLFSDCKLMNCKSLPKGLTIIEDHAFAYCSSLALTSLPAGVTTIGSDAFSDCTNLALTSLPDGVQSIGKEAFKGCYNITKIQYNGNKLTEIGEDAFFCREPIKTVLITDNEILKNYDWAGDNRILVSEEEPVLSGTYTVKFDPNGGEGSMADQTIKCNEQTALNNNQFTRKNYNFYGWATEPDGDIVYRDAEKIYKNSDFSGKTITLYALWDIFGEIPLPEPEPEPIPRTTIHCSKNVYVSDKEGKAVCDAIIGDELTIKYAPEFKEDYGFKQWNITGAVPKDKTETTTTITVNSFEVWISYDREISVEYKNETPPPADSTPVKKLTFKNKKEFMMPGTSRNNAATPIYINDTPEVIYITSNSDIVCVTPTGDFIAVSPGKAVVTAYCGNKKATCEVEVYSVPKEVAIGAGWGLHLSEDGTNNFSVNVDGEIFDLKGYNPIMYAGEHAFLKANFYPYDITVPYKVKWESTNNKALTVDNGLLTAKYVTEPTHVAIWAIVKPSGHPVVKQGVSIKVMPSNIPSNKADDKGCALALKKSNVKLQLNVAQKDSCELGITVSPKKGGNVADKEINYISTNPNIVRVSKGKEFSINSKGKGTASIKLTAKNPGSAYVLIGTVDKNDPTKVNYKKCKVTVTNPVSEISITGDARGLLKDASSKMPNITIRKGEWDTLNAKISPDLSTDVSKIKWSASGGVTVNNGRIFAKKVTKSGKPAKVTAKCGKKKVTVSVTVTK